MVTLSKEDLSKEQSFLTILCNAAETICKNDRVELRKPDTKNYKFEIGKDKVFKIKKNNSWQSYEQLDDQGNSKRLYTYNCNGGAPYFEVDLEHEKIFQFYIYEQFKFSSRSTNCSIEYNNHDMFTPIKEFFSEKDKNDTFKKRFIDLKECNKFLEIKFAHEFIYNRKKSNNSLGDTELNHLFKYDYEDIFNNMKNNVCDDRIYSINMPDETNIEDVKNDIKSVFDKYRTIINQFDNTTNIDNGTTQLPFLKYNNELYATNLLSSGQMLFDLTKLMLLYSSYRNAGEKTLYYICFFKENNTTPAGIKRLCKNIANILCQFKNCKNIFEFVQPHGNFKALYSMKEDNINKFIIYNVHGNHDFKFDEIKYEEPIKLFSGYDYCNNKIEKRFCFLLAIKRNPKFTIKPIKSECLKLRINDTYYFAFRNKYDKPHYLIYESEDGEIECGLAYDNKVPDFLRSEYDNQLNVKIGDKQYYIRKRNGQDWIEANVTLKR